MKNLKSILVLGIAIITLYGCETNNVDEETDNNNNNVSSVAKNTLTTATSTGALNYYSFTSYSLSNGIVYDFTVAEKLRTAQSTSLGTYIRIFVKELPTADVTFAHRQDANFDIETGQYYFNNARIGDSGNQEWYAPFINSRPTADLKVTVANGIATFTVIDAELSDNFVAPITSTEKFTVSFSINVSELTGTAVNNFTALAN